MKCHAVDMPSVYRCTSPDLFSTVRADVNVCTMLIAINQREHPHHNLWMAQSLKRWNLCRKMKAFSKLYSPTHAWSFTSVHGKPLVVEPTEVTIWHLTYCKSYPHFICIMLDLWVWVAFFFFFPPSLLLMMAY